ncbi:hypothetical protein AB5J51_37815 [Streptomyces sp. R33]|uniref:DUF402 domain-containing protein n=1 Tax=Streptomyces sp. R33 TaxID=3238629 RepID=A0AB39YED8_9ACTN
MDSLIREYVAPAAKSAGFRKKGRGFWTVGGRRLDYALLTFQVYAVDPEATVFDVEFHAAPEPYWDWVYRGHQPVGKVPDSSGALVTGRVVPPPSVAHRPDEGMPFRTRWAMRPEGEDACGRALAETLSAKVLPRIQLMTDRAHLLDVVRSGDMSLMKRMTPLLREIVLRIDDITAIDLDALVAEAEASRVPVGFIDWVHERRRAAENGWHKPRE